MTFLNKVKIGITSLLFATTVSAGPVVDALYQESDPTGVCVAFVQAYANGIFFVSQGHESVEDTFQPENLTDPSDLTVYRKIVSGGMVAGLLHKENGGHVDRTYAMNVYDGLVEGCVASRGHFGFVTELPHLPQESKDLYKEIYQSIMGGKVNYMVPTASSKNVADPRGVWATIEGCAGQRLLWERQCASKESISGHSEAQIIESIKKARHNCNNYSLTKFFECTHNFLERKKTLTEEIEKDL